MANYATLKAAIAVAIKENGNKEITGNLLQQQLLAIVNSLGVGYQYIGTATPATNPGTPDQNVFYLASTAGTYANFDGLVLADGEIAILKYNGTWSKDGTGAITADSLAPINSTLGKTELNLSVVSGTTYGWAATRTPVKINAGDSFGIKVLTTGSIDPPMLTVQYEGDQNATSLQRVSFNQQYTFTASRNIVAVGFYIGGVDIHTGGEFSAIISNPLGVLPRLESLEQTTQTQQEQIDNIETSLGDVSQIEVLPNLFDKENVIINNIYLGDVATPTLVANSNYGCLLVEIPDDTANYILNYKDYQIDAYNESKQRISTVYFNANVAHGVPSGTKYLTISLLKEHISNFMLVKGDTLPQQYVGYGSYLKDGIYKPKTKIYHVGKTSTTDDYFEYQNLTELLRSLENDDSEKIIYVHGAEYDIFVEYGGAAFINTLTGNESWRDVSVFVPNNTKIIGLGKVVLKFAPTSEQIVNAHNAQLFSPLNISGNCHIENIEIEVENGRYCVHDEITAGISENSRHIYKNVKMTKRQGLDGNPQAFGCGFGDGMYYEFDGCDIISYTTAFSMHNTDTTPASKRTKIVINNCHIHSTGTTDTPIVFRNSSTIQVEHIVNIFNTYIKGSENYVILKIENPSGNVNVVNCFNVSLFGCNQITPSIVGITPANLYEVKQYNTAGIVFYNKKLVFNTDGSVTWVEN